MGVKNVQIIFDNPRAVFMPFETVTGRVIITVKSSAKIKSRYYIPTDYANKCILVLKIIWFCFRNKIEIRRRS